jgi:hypothetical protein
MHVIIFASIPGPKPVIHKHQSFIPLTVLLEAFEESIRKDQGHSKENGRRRTDIVRIFTEALSADVQVVLAHDSVSVATNPAHARAGAKLVGSGVVNLPRTWSEAERTDWGPATTLLLHSPDKNVRSRKNGFTGRQKAAGLLTASCPMFSDRKLRPAGDG